MTMLAALALTACAATTSITPTPDPLAAADAFSAHREYSAALDALQTAADVHPADAVIPQKMGEIYAAQHRWDEAIRAFSTALAANPQSVPALLGRAAAELQLRQSISARNDARVAQALGGDAAALVGQSYLQTQDYAAARTAFDGSPAPAAQFARAVFSLLDDPAAGRQVLAQLPASLRKNYLLDAIKGVPDDELAGTAGIALTGLQEWELAHVALSAAVQTDPARADWWAFLGRAQSMLGLPALDAFHRAETLDPALTLVPYFRGLYLRRQGLLSEALDEFLAGMKIDPQNVALATEAAATLAEMGDLVSAEAWYQSVVRAEPDNPDFQRLLTEFYVLRGYRVAESGLAAAERLVELQPDDAHALDLRGWAKFQMGDVGAAEADVRRAVQLAPDDVAARFHLARILLALHRDAEAQTELTHVVDWDTTGVYRPRAEALRTP